MLGEYKQAIEKLRNIGLNRILIMIANGPSILEVPLEQLKGKSNIDIMCINKPEPRVWPATYWAFCDQTQYVRNKDSWESYRGTIINASSVRARHQNQVLVKSLSGKGFSKDLLRGFFIGRSSTFANWQTALWMGYDKIYIFGLDMSAVGGKMHFYGQNPDVTNESRAERFRKEADNYLYAATSVLTPDECKRFIICSTYNQHAFMQHFTRLDQTKAIEVILNEK